MNHGGAIAMLGLPGQGYEVDWGKVITHMLTLQGIYGREMFETWYKMTQLLQDNPTLVEHVRGRLARQLCWQHKADDGALPIVTLSPEWENAFAESLVGGGEDKQLAMAPSRLQDFIRSTRDTFERIAMSGENAVLLTGPMIRPYVRSIIERFRGQTVVMSQNEVHPKARLRTLGQV